MVGRILAGVGALALAGSFAHAAWAQEAATTACLPYPVVVKNLAKSYHETPVARAIGGEGNGVMVIFASDGGATWTAVSVRAKDRIACVVAAGTDWQGLQMPGTGL